MSAKYTCDYCGKKATYHIGGVLGGYSHRSEVSKKLYKKGSCDFWVTLEIQHKWCEDKQDEDIDICEKCLRELEKEAMKKICKE